MRHQIQTKYRELSIIIFIIIICFRGSIFQLSTEPKSAFTIFTNGTFCRTSGTGKKVSPEKVYVNGTQLADGTIVKIDEVFYKMSLSTDQQSYTLQETYLLTPTIEIIK